VTFFSENSAFFSFEPKEKGEKPDFKATNRICALEALKDLRSPWKPWKATPIFEIFLVFEGKKGRLCSENAQLPTRPYSRYLAGKHNK
jgi:hypothetical protein